MKALGTDYRNATAITGEFTKLPAGGYIVEITGVKDVTDKEYLNITYDIAEGEFKAFYADEWGTAHPYAHSFVRSYKKTGDPKKDKKIYGMFRGFLHLVDECNGTNFEPQAETGFDEQMLVHKRIGVVIGYEEYESDSGDIYERTRVQAVKTLDAIKAGNYKVPELKKISPRPASPVAGFEAINPDDVPF